MDGVSKSTSPKAEEEVRKFEFVDDSEEDAADEKIGNYLSGLTEHTAIIHINLETETASHMVCRALDVDKEPARSKAKRELSIEGKFLVARFTSSDRKYLQKSINNFLDMCDLAKQTLDVVGSYKPNDNEGRTSQKKKKELLES